MGSADPMSTMASVAAGGRVQRTSAEAESGWLSWSLGGSSKNSPETLAIEENPGRHEL